MTAFSISVRKTLVLIVRSQEICCSTNDLSVCGTTKLCLQKIRFRQELHSIFLFFNIKIVCVEANFNSSKTNICLD